MIPVDSRYGPVTAVRAAVLRGRLHAAFADLAATTGYAWPLGNPTVSGASWRDPGEARRRALGEAAERYCGHLVPADRLVEASWHELGPGAADPDELALYSKEQLGREGFPFSGLTRSDRTAWVRGTGPDGEPAWVPAALAWLVPFPSATGAPIVLPVSAGIAAGPSLAAARAAALAEVVERHALATAWASGRPFPLLAGLRLPAVPGARLRAYAVPNLLDAPVVLCLAEDSGGMAGAGCALAPQANDPVAVASWKAAAEAVQSLDTTAQLAAGDLPEWERPSGPLAPHRADRAYAAAYRADFADVTDVTCHLQLLADPAFTARVLARFAGGGTAPPSRPARFDLDAALAARGLRPITVDLTTPDVAACGLAVARVVVPGLRATAPAAFPMLGDGAEPLPPSPDPLPVPHA
ncbi:ribosomal protein S12 methylthiotransferase accessory factor [Thermocatellispora tengchongensis]|uniref:Ribosomal protein S12 methylthiotransferase accessory factor n=1 Tax=Thermocatellispora tengchongensis TaxID=1073253 RepID=A0A840PFZ7_9ACTN|nr:YcaO-like family protein [Thermocatellispora tengchongensis]MBB5134965.1 ribosomal protein S12 methylthiotransferase accessory factor [Thermocatellispora tengchongensis]